MADEKEIEPESPDGTIDDDLKDGDASADDASSKSDSDKSENRFKGLGNRLSDRLAAKESDADDEDDDEDEDDPADGDLDEQQDDKPKADAKGGDPQATAAAKGGKGEQSDDKNEDEDSDGSRFEIVDAEGSKYDLELPQGATIKFPGDGKTVEAKSIDELVQYAQKGVAFDRVTAKQGQVIGGLRGKLSELEEDSKADQELVKQLILGTISDEDLATLEQHYKKLEDDPDALEAAQALKEKREREQAAEKVTAPDPAQAAEFWKATDEAITEDVAKFEFLEPDDVPEIRNAFNEAYLTRRTALIETYVKIAPDHGISEAAAVRQADEDAITETLNRKTLNRVMKVLDDKYRKKAEKGSGKRQARDSREAEGHNRQVEAQRDRARNPANRSLRAGGAQVNTREPQREKDKPKGFEGQIDKSLSRFARLRRTVSDNDGDDDE